MLNSKLSFISLCPIYFKLNASKKTQENIWIWNHHRFKIFFIACNFKFPIWKIELKSFAIVYRFFCDFRILKSINPLVWGVQSNYFAVICFCYDDTGIITFTNFPKLALIPAICTSVIQKNKLANIGISFLNLFTNIFPLIVCQI